MFPMITERGNTSSLPCKPETGEITYLDATLPSSKVYFQKILDPPLSLQN